MSIEERIKAALARYPERDDRHISKSLHGITVAMVRAVRAGQPVPLPPAPAVDTAPASGKVITLESIQARYDIASAIRREIAKLKPGHLIVESEMRTRAAGKDANRFRRAVENCDEFKANRIKLQLDPDGGEAAWYWGDSSTISAAARVRDSL